MPPEKLRSLWTDIKMVSQTQQGRQALTTTGALIAGTYLGYVGPDLLATMHDALGYYATKYPFLDPLQMSADLWGGAKYFAAAALDYAGEVADRVRIEVAQNIREATSGARDLLSRGSSRGLDAARQMFEETSLYVEGTASDLVGAVSEAAKTGWNFLKSNWGTVAAVAAAAKEAYDYFEKGESLYRRLLGRGKEEAAPDTATEDERNIATNTAIAGEDVLRAGDREIARTGAAPRIDVDIDQVVWVSDQMYARMNAEGQSLSTMKEETARKISGVELGTIRSSIYGSGPREQQVDVDRILSGPSFGTGRISLDHIDLATGGITNTSREDWGESPQSVSRLEAMRGRSLGSLGSIEISDPWQSPAESAANDNDKRVRRGSAGPDYM